MPTSMLSPTMTFFDGHPLALASFRSVRSTLEELGGADITITKAQVSFRRGRSFAFLWTPHRRLGRPTDVVVLSIALDHRLTSPRFKEVVRAGGGRWLHHLELRSVDQLDGEVNQWLADAWGSARRSAA